MQTVCAIFVNESLYGCGIAYTITAASSVKYVFLINPLSATVSYFLSVALVLFLVLC